MNAEQIKALEARHVLQTYKRQPVVFVRGEGTRLFDIEGRGYLDFLSGIGVTVLGHAHAGLAAAIADQAKTLIHMTASPGTLFLAAKEAFFKCQFPITHRRLDWDDVDVTIEGQGTAAALTFEEAGDDRIARGSLPALDRAAEIP